MKIYHTDDSGINLQPHPSSNVPFKDRYYFHTRKDTVGFFNGPGLKNIAYRFQELLKTRISQLDIAKDWIEFPDLFFLTQDVLTGPAIEAMCGPALIDQCPTFVEDFWKLDGDILYFFKGFPRWLAPRAWKNRDNLLDSVKKWHTYARENFDASFVESDGHDRCYGSPLMRSRQNYLSQIDGLNADALASQDLGLIGAENANSIPAVFWLFAELLQQPTGLCRSREAVGASLLPSSRLDNPSLDIESLCSKPLLQSIYAETLRLYTSLFALRSAAHADFQLGDWLIPCDKMIAVDRRVAHMDTNIWNTGNSITRSEGPYPLHKFSARFIEDETDSTSGPLRSRRPKPPSTATESQGSVGRYTMEGLSGAWLPFGGGSRQCPGRNFAKQEIILSFALIATLFDSELLEGTKKDSLRPDMKYYGLGTLPPKGKVPFRIRRR